MADLPSKEELDLIQDQDIIKWIESFKKKGKLDRFIKKIGRAIQRAARRGYHHADVDFPLLVKMESNKVLNVLIEEIRLIVGKNYRLDPDYSDLGSLKGITIWWWETP